VLYACIKVLLPITCVLLLGGALWELLIPTWHAPKLIDNPLPWFDYHPFRWAEWTRGGAAASLVRQVLLAAIGTIGFSVIALWIAYAFVTRRTMKQRLTEADPIPEGA
jgi:hypothetical protein